MGSQEDRLDLEEIKQLNQFENIFRYKTTWAYQKFLQCPQNIIALFTGNQAMKTSSVAHSYVLRIMSWHPVPKKNVLYFECDEQHFYNMLTLPKDGKCTVCGHPVNPHRRNSRTFRFASETLPGQSENVSDDGRSAEVKNTQYPEFKKWLPPHLIKKDITFRNTSMMLNCPYGGDNIIVEFVSYNQSVQSTAGPQRLSIWEDEEAPYEFHEEQIPRIIAEDGDIIISLTPANRVTWTYDQVFEKASVFYRTKTVVDFLNRDQKEKIYEQEEVTDSTLSIAVIQAATDDNPTLSPSAINVLFENFDDPDALAIRRFGIFKQVSGRIYKAFNPKVHIIDSERWFPAGLPDSWTYARSIDYHEHVPWAVGWIAISPEDEAFIYDEINPSPEKMVTREISQIIAERSADTHFIFNGIDPLASKTQTNTGTSVLEDMNKYFTEYKMEGICSGGRWEAFETKSTRGRDEIRKRLKNAIICERPFNNERVKDGIRTYLPTLWIYSRCKETIKSLRQWRLEEWSSVNALVTKDMKETPQQKYSHFCTAFEAVFKDKRFRARRPEYKTFNKTRTDPHRNYFNVRER